MIKIKVIKPRANMFNVNAIERAVGDAMKDLAKDAQKDLEKTTSTWEHDVDFKIEMERGGFTVATTDEIYGYVDDGTRAHEIRPKNGKQLKFTVGGAAKTTPRVIGSGPGRRGSTVVRSKRVWHPGTKAREFTETLQQKYDREVPLRIGQALGKVLDRGGD